MGGERVVAGDDGPDMDVVKQRDSLQFLHLATQTVYVDVVWGALKQHVDDLGE